MSKIHTVTADLASYLEYKESYLRAGSYKVYRLFSVKFRQFLADNDLSELPTKQITPAICERYRRYILKLHTDPITRNKEIRQMRQFLKCRSNFPTNCCYDIGNGGNWSRYNHCSNCRNRTDYFKNSTKQRWFRSRYALGNADSVLSEHKRKV